MPDQPLFDEKTRRKLEQLMLHAPRVRSGAMKGERRSNKRGTSIEFADYRNYSPGDDLRRLDWNIYARLDRPLMKVFEDEEDLAVHLLLDSSGSMAGTPQENPDWEKFTYARRLLAALGYVSLASNDRLVMTALEGSDTADTPRFGPARGRQWSMRLFQYMNSLEAAGTTDLNATLKRYAMQIGRPGLCVLASDLFSPSGYVDGLNALIGKGCEVVVLHVLAPDELEPPLAGDLRLVDVETGMAQEVSIDGGMRDLYMQRVAAWRDGIRAECLRRGAGYVAIDTRTAWERVILQDLRRVGVVR